MKPMLAGKFEPELVEKQLPVCVQPKLDGIRILIKDGVAITRSLKPVRAVWLQELIQKDKNLLEGLDGEITSGSATSSSVYRDTNSSIMSFDKPSKFVINVFDNFLLSGGFLERLQYLKESSLPDYCEIVETHTVQTLQKIYEYDELFLSLGYEGTIIRSPTGKYKYGRSTPREGLLIKLKSFKDSEAIITGFTERMHNENSATINELGYMERSSHKENMIPMNTLGAILATGKFPNGKTYRIRIGTGFSEAERKRLWEDRAKLKGAIVKFKYFEGGIKEAPRFPVFLGFRDRLDTDEEVQTLRQGDLFL